MHISVRNQELFIEGQVFDNYEVKQEIGRGANGIVYLVQNKTLQREEALKIWVKNMKDNRDKLKQGKFEAQKLARVNGKNAVQIYNAQEFNGYVVATMEYFEGQTMRNFIKGRNNQQIIYILRKYLEAIRQTSYLDTFHGDPHDRNVLIHEVIIDYEKDIELKLCDFGTSIFSGKEQSIDRHWGIVKNTILHYTKGMKAYEDGKQCLEGWLKSLHKFETQLKNEADNQKREELYDPRIFTAPYQDYLKYLEAENTCN